MRPFLATLVSFLILFPQSSIAQDFKTVEQTSTLSIAGYVKGDRVNCVDDMASGFECKGVDLLAWLDFDEVDGLDAGDDVATTGFNDIWGWTDPDTGDNYAILGRNEGVSFIRITDPENPVMVADLPMTAGSRRTTWRDMKTYNGYVFVVADNSDGNGIQIANLAQLRDISGDPQVIEADLVYTFPGDTLSTDWSAHNIVINEESGFAYAVGGNICGGALAMLNIQDPLNPIDAGCAAAEGTGRAGTGYVHDAQCVIYQGLDAEHQGKEICFSANETAISIMDVTDKTAPVVLSTATYPNASYIHQGWLNEAQTHFVTNDELDERGFGNNTLTMFWDVSDLDDPILETTFESPLPVIDHNLYIKGNLLYQSNYEAGLRILNLDDITDPKDAGYFDTFPDSDNTAFNGSWSNYPFFEDNVVIVSDQRRGLFVLEAAPPRLTSNEEGPSSSALKLTTYPNPVVDRVEIVIPETEQSGEAKLSIVDVNGRELLSEFISTGDQVDGKHSLDLSSLSSGYYVAKLERNNKIYTSGLVVGVK